MLSINKLANKLAKKLIDNYEYYQVGVTKLPSGATVIDTGVESHGGYNAGLTVTARAFAPATISLTCAKTGTTFTHGNINYEIIKNSVEN